MLSSGNMCDSKIKMIFKYGYLKVNITLPLMNNDHQII